MKRMLLRGLFGFVIVMLALPSGMAQQGLCRLSITMLNSNRHVLGEVNTECSWPRAPFGNWGVESNFGGRTNAFQFAGWKGEDNLLQWDSCTSDCQRDTDYSCLWYNHDSNANGYCDDQVSNAEYSYATICVDMYGRNCPYDSNRDGSCDWGGCYGITQFSVSGQYLTLYELDDWLGGDDYVGNLSVDSGCCTVSNLSCTPRSCYARYSQTYPTVSYYPGPLNTTANVRMRIDWGSFIDYSGICAQLGHWDPGYNCH